MESALYQQAERLFPGYEIRVAFLEASASDRCLYKGKRCIIDSGA